MQLWHAKFFLSLLVINLWNFLLKSACLSNNFQRCKTEADGEKREQKLDYFWVSMQEKKFSHFLAKKHEHAFKNLVKCIRNIKNDSKMSKIISFSCKETRISATFSIFFLTSFVFSRWIKVIFRQNELKASLKVGP